MITFDPSEFIRGFQQILISDKKRIGFLFGAGTSLSRKNQSSLTVPAIGQMTAKIVEKLGSENSSFKTALNEIKSELGEINFNIETLLSNLEQKASIIAGGTLNSLEKTDFIKLISEVKKNVREQVSVHLDDDKLVGKDVTQNLVQTDFANWIGQAERKYPIEIFTTNYDFLFELGLEHREIPYYDGFCGSLNPFFNPESVEDLSFLQNQTKLWKIHGSLGWHYNTDSGKILRVNPIDDDILIYPSTLKYKDSKKQPYESLLDRLSNFLKQDDSILITCGYSWGDEHINARIISALKTNTTSHVIGLFFDKYWDENEKVHFSLDENSQLAGIGKNNPKISIYGGRSAIIGCNFGIWKLKSKPTEDDMENLNLYFQKDNNILTESGEEIWTGEGNFTLPDFGILTTFLNSMISDNEIKKIGEDVRK